MKLLLLSNSTNFGSGFLEHAEDMLRVFLSADLDEVLFVPYAAVRFAFDDFAQKVAERFSSFGCDVRPIHQEQDPVGAVERAQAVVIGGGNTFQLLTTMYQEKLLEPIQARVAGGASYIGWSAGSNVACPTIRTTNDMPIVEPPSFDALGLVSFQINPHFTDAQIPNHGGETRSERLLEFVTANPNMPVIGLREGTAIVVEDDSTALVGELPAVLLKGGAEPDELVPGPLPL
jgi:dipeptidase E